ncbi:MAG: FKBP-type peptidyl-prolyl cis-trans isomerase [Deltaproteobacteria bacterium]|nr:FKBP-type peptidyl-prolyl cis-trans isomerase [Deltaproteobacteria bacterium]
MCRLPLLVALVCLVVACKKDEPTRSNNASGATDPTSAEKPVSGAPTRSGKVDLRPSTTPPTAARAATPLPPEANPPGVPVVSGTLQVDRDVRYIDEKVGTGASPVSGKPVTVHYSGWLTDGKKFDSSVDRGDPIKFNFDGGQVIPGWDIGLSSMKVGGKRRIIIPANLAYGDREMGDAIPPGSMLVFDVELVAAAN